MLYKSNRINKPSSWYCCCCSMLCYKIFLSSKVSFVVFDLKLMAWCCKTIMFNVYQHTQTTPSPTKADRWSLHCFISTDKTAFVPNIYLKLALGYFPNRWDAEILCSLLKYCVHSDVILPGVIFEGTLIQS